MSYRVLMLETGGTFATDRGEDGLRAIGSASVFDFPDVRRRSEAEGFVFERISPFKILSENMTIRRLEELTAAVRGLESADFDGVIVTHGTDTLAYSVNLIAFALGSIDYPLIFVSADHPLADPRSNGTANFLAAMTLIAEGEKGVFAVFRNGDGAVYVHRGGRLRQMDDIHAGFYSQGNIPYGVIENGRFRFNENEKNRRQPNGRAGFPSSLLSRGILQLHSYPGLDYRSVPWEKTDAVLVRTYHTGMFCAAGGGENLDTLLAAAAERDAAVIVSGGSAEEDRYASALRHGDKAVFIPDTAPEALYAKMLLSYGTADTRAALAYVKGDALGETVRS